MVGGDDDIDAGSDTYIEKGAMDDLNSNINGVSDFGDSIITGQTTMKK